MQSNSGHKWCCIFEPTRGAGLHNGAVWCVGQLEMPDYLRLLKEAVDTLHCSSIMSAPRTAKHIQIMTAELASVQANEEEEEEEEEAQQQQQQHAGGQEP